MTPETIAIVTASLAIGAGLVKIIELLVGKLRSQPGQQQANGWVNGISKQIRVNKHQLEEIYDWTKELHRWHDIRDQETGVPAWYTDRRLAPAIYKLSEKLDNLSLAIEKFKLKQGAKDGTL